MPLRPAGARAPAELAAVQPGGDVGLDSDDGRAALDHLGQEARDAAPARAIDRGADAGGPADSAAPALVVPVLHRPGSVDEVAGPPPAPDLEAPGPPRGPSLDARPLRELRRPGGHLPADDLHDHRPADPGV